MIVPEHTRKENNCLLCRCNSCDCGHLDLNLEIVACRVTGRPECPGIAGDLSRAEPRDCKEREKCPFGLVLSVAEGQPGQA